jgi:hypothetical protein
MYSPVCAVLRARTGSDHDRLVQVISGLDIDRSPIPISQGDYVTQKYTLRLIKMQRDSKRRPASQGLASAKAYDVRSILDLQHLVTIILACLTVPGAARAGTASRQRLSCVLF